MTGSVIGVCTTSVQLAKRITYTRSLAYRRVYAIVVSMTGTRSSSNRRRRLSPRTRFWGIRRTSTWSSTSGRTVLLITPTGQNTLSHHRKISYGNAHSVSGIPSVRHQRQQARVALQPPQVQVLRGRPWSVSSSSSRCVNSGCLMGLAKRSLSAHGVIRRPVTEGLRATLPQSCQRLTADCGMVHQTS